MKNRVKHFRGKEIPNGYEPLDGPFVVDVVTDNLSDRESSGRGETRAEAYKKAIERYPQADAILLGQPHDISQNMQFVGGQVRLRYLRSPQRFAYAAVPLKKTE